MSFKSVSLVPRPKCRWSWIVLVIVVILPIAGFLVVRYYPRAASPRWYQYRAYLQNPSALEEFILRPGQDCDGAPFAFPTTGVIFGLWNQSYRPGHIHAGLDIFSGTEPGITPVYAAYPGYLIRKSDWVSTVIIRIPNDPLQPGRQIWTYYTHMADAQGNSFVSSEFPPGTSEVFVEAGTFLGYMGNYSGDTNNPTGLHLHFSVVKDDGDGNFLNELEIENTYDPTPYFKMPVNHRDNPDEFPACAGEVTFEDWDLASDE